MLLRKLPVPMTKEALNGMLLFAEDLVDTYFANGDNPDDHGYRCAIARFRTPAAAQEAQRRLNGKPNPTGDTTMIVELLFSETSGSQYGSKSPDPNKQLSTSASSRGSSVNGHTGRQSSRFNSTFQSMGSMNEKVSAGPNANAFESDYYTPQTPRGGTIGDQRITGKSMINDDSADDETGDILKDPVAYARNGHHTARRQSNQQLPLNRMANLTLNTASANSQPPSHLTSPTQNGFGINREMQAIHSPTSALSPTSLNGAIPGMNPLSPHSAFPLSPSYPRHQYPPANPADQNPPCNTLYVGNLPIDTSEDELKALFSKQRGYKRLCFRTKHNGPMCFVEFEDVSFATKALNELYGQPLHNSVKGGIRLSFSKNPLGVRTGQQNSLNSPLSPGGLGLGGLGAPPGFSTANGPPPGLAVPPGLSPPIGAGSNMNGFFGPNSPPGPPSRGRNSGSNYATSNAPSLNGIGGAYSDFMLGR